MWTLRVTLPAQQITTVRKAPLGVFRVRLGRVVGQAGLAAGLCVALMAPAAAQDVCALIRSELASLHQSGGGGRSAQLQASIQQQARELGRAQTAYNRFQCAFGASPQCGSIVAAIEQMSANLDRMERQLARSGGGRDQRRVAELERAFATQCAPSQRREQPRGLLASIFGSQPRQPEAPTLDEAVRMGLPHDRQQHRGFYRPGETVREPNGFPAGGRTYRTMCVRTSDGFYWPISFSTTRERFDTDRSLCAAMCPGTDVALFAYRNPGEQVDAMIHTLTGEPYTEQSYAFAYREAFDPNNRCTPSNAVFEEMRASAASTAPAVAAAPTVPQPGARPDMASDPETRALDDAGTSFTALGAMTRNREEGERMVRVVGPDRGYTAN